MVKQGTKMAKAALDQRRRKHGVLPPTGRCYACGAYLKYTAKQGSLYYCDTHCMYRKPPKMVLAELHHGKPFEEFALDYLNSGGTVAGLARICGVHRQAVLEWLRRFGIKRYVVWSKDDEW